MKRVIMAAAFAIAAPTLMGIAPVAAHASAAVSECEGPYTTIYNVEGGYMADDPAPAILVYKNGDEGSAPVQFCEGTVSGSKLLTFKRNATTNTCLNVSDGAVVLGSCSGADAEWNPIVWAPDAGKSNPAHLLENWGTKGCATQEGSVPAVVDYGKCINEASNTSQAWNLR